MSQRRSLVNHFSPLNVEVIEKNFGVVEEKVVQLVRSNVELL